MSQGSLSCFSAPGALIELLRSIYYIQGNRLMDEGNGWEVGYKDEDRRVLLCWSFQTPRGPTVLEQKDVCVGQCILIFRYSELGIFKI